LGVLALFCSGALSSAFVFPVGPLGGSRQVMEQQHHTTVSLISISPQWQQQQPSIAS